MVGVLARHIYALTSHKNIAAVDYIFTAFPPKKFKKKPLTTAPCRNYPKVEEA
jgi:hypothetical protein